MKNQALFSLKDKSKKLKCCLLQILFGALTVKTVQDLWDCLGKGKIHLVMELHNRFTYLGSVWRGKSSCLIAK